MIDKENEVYTRVNEIVMDKFPKANMDSEYVSFPAGFPHVSLYQSDSYTPSNREDNSLKPKFAVITFDVNVYSNKKTGKKQECKKIMNEIDDVMHSMNFRRIVMTPVPNLNDSTIYRLTARYQGEASETTFYRR